MHRMPAGSHRRSAVLLAAVAGIQAIWWGRTLTGGKVFFLRDLLPFLLPYKVEAARAIAEGRFPILSHRLMGGMPLWAHPSAQIADPSTLLYAFIFDHFTAFAWDSFLHSLAASGAVYLLARSLGIGRILSGWAAVAYASCGPVLSGWNIREVPPVGLPLVALGGALLARRRTAASFIFAALGVAYMALFPDPPFVISAAALAVALCLARARAAERWKRLAILLAAGATGGMLSGAFLLPALGALRESSRAVLATWSAGTSLGWRWIELVAPNALGVPGAAGAPAAAIHRLTEGLYTSSLYLGGSVLVGLLCAARSCRRRTDIALAGTLVVMTVLAHGDAIPGAEQLWSLAHAHFPEKLLLPAYLAAILLAARGLRLAWGRKPPQRWVLGTVSVLALFAALGTVASAGSAARWLVTDPALLGRQVLLGCGVLAVCALVGAIPWPRAAARRHWLLLACACAEGTLSATTSLLAAPGEPFRDPGALLRRRLDPGTSVACCSPFYLESAGPTVDGPALPPYALVLEQVRRLAPLTGILEGLAYPVAPDIGVFDPWLHREVMARGLPTLEHLLGDRPAAGVAGRGVLRVFQTWGIEWLVSLRPAAPGSSPSSDQGAEEAATGLVSMARRERLPPALGVWIYKLSDPFPRVWVSEQWSRSADMLGSLEALAADADRPVLQGGPDPPDRTAGDDRPPSAGARIVDLRLTEDRIAATVQTLLGAVLVHSAILRNGWTATVDGNPAEVFLADALHMAVLVPPGVHRVEMVYRMPLGREGLCLTALAGIIIGLVGLGMDPAGVTGERLPCRDPRSSYGGLAPAAPRR